MATKSIQEQLANVANPNDCRINVRTIVKLPGGKKNDYQERITKSSMVRCMLSYPGKYTEMVKRTLVLEGKDEAAKEFEAEKLPFGQRIGDTCFIQHGEQQYVQVLVIEKIISEYFLDGKTPLAYEEIDGEGHLMHNGASVTKLPTQRGDDEYSQGGAEFKIQVRTFKIESVVSVGR